MVDNDHGFRIYKWAFEDDTNKRPHQATELKFGRAKIFLYESLYRSISRHDINECFQLLKILPRESTLDPYAFFRFIFILIESNRTEKLNKNVLIYLESLISRTNISKPDAFVEFLAYFIKYNRIDDAKELFNQRHRHMTRKSHRELPFVNVNLRCYEFLLNYLGWKNNIAKVDEEHTFDLSIQGWVVNAIICLKATKSNYEYFVMRVLDVLLFYGFTKKAYIFSSEFALNNPDNIGAQLLHYHLLKRLVYNLEQQDDAVPMDCDLDDERQEKNRLDDLEDINNFSQDMEDEIFRPEHYPIRKDHDCILNNLRRLDCTRSELMNCKLSQENAIIELENILDELENVDQVRNMKRWERLKEVIEYVLKSDKDMVVKACFLWQSRYKRFWEPLDFVALAGRRVSVSGKKLIAEVLALIKNNLNNPRRNK